MKNETDEWIKKFVEVNWKQTIARELNNVMSNYKLKETEKEAISIAISNLFEVEKIREKTAKEIFEEIDWIIEDDDYMQIQKRFVELRNKFLTKSEGENDK